MSAEDYASLIATQESYLCPNAPNKIANCHSLLLPDDPAGGCASSSHFVGGHAAITPGCIFQGVFYEKEGKECGALPSVSGGFTLCWAERTVR